MHLLLWCPCLLSLLPHCPHVTIHLDWIILFCLLFALPKQPFALSLLIDQFFLFFFFKQLTGFFYCVLNKSFTSASCSLLLCLNGGCYSGCLFLHLWGHTRPYWSDQRCITWDCQSAQGQKGDVLLGFSELGQCSVGNCIDKCSNCTSKLFVCSHSIPFQHSVFQLDGAFCQHLPLFKCWTWYFFQCVPCGLVLQSLGVE